MFICLRYQVGFSRFAVNPLRGFTSASPRIATLRVAVLWGDLAASCLLRFTRKNITCR